MAETETDRQPRRPLSIRLTEELEQELEAAQKETGLSRADLVRLSIERGVKILKAQLTTPVSA